MRAKKRSRRSASVRPKRRITLVLLLVVVLAGSVPFVAIGAGQDRAATDLAGPDRTTETAGGTGDRRADQLAVYLRDGADPGAVRERLQQTFADAPALEIADAREIRRHSLAVFDRSFAVTYVLVVVAVAVGLVGTLQALAVQGLERRGEMAMLRFLGFRVRDVAAGQALEAGLTGAFGGLLGLGVGGVVAVLLVKVVNDQSFLWALPVDFPVGLLAGAWLVLVAATAAGGWVLGRRQGRQDPTRAVAEE